MMPREGRSSSLLTGIAVCLRRLALGNEAAWTPFLSEPVARLVFRSLPIAMGLGAWFTSQSFTESFSGGRRFSGGCRSHAAAARQR